MVIGSILNEKALGRISDKALFIIKGTSASFSYIIKCNPEVGAIFNHIYFTRHFFFYHEQHENKNEINSKSLY